LLPFVAEGGALIAPQFEPFHRRKCENQSRSVPAKRSSTLSTLSVVLVAGVRGDAPLTKEPNTIAVAVKSDHADLQSRNYIALRWNKRARLAVPPGSAAPQRSNGAGSFIDASLRRVGSIVERR
jgi:hypothetical protein